jgi:phage tail sheath protein FI
MYFPSVLAYDRLRGRFETFAPCGAVAGMLARLDEAVPVWSPVDADDPILRPGLRPACAVDAGERARLASHGINVLQAVRASSRQRIEPRTLAGGAGLAPEWRYLSARRLALFIVDSIERGTRWVVFEQNGPALWRKLQRQVGEFLAELEREGAFPGRVPGEAGFVICDERLNPPTQPAGTVNLLLGFAAMRAGEHHTYLLTHQPAGSRVQHVSLNRLQSAGGRPPLDPEIDVATLLADALRR